MPSFSSLSFKSDFDVLRSTMRADYTTTLLVTLMVGHLLWSRSVAALFKLTASISSKSLSVATVMVDKNCCANEEHFGWFAFGFSDSSKMKYTLVGLPLAPVTSPGVELSYWSTDTIWSERWPLAMHGHWT